MNQTNQCAPQTWFQFFFHIPIPNFFSLPYFQCLCMNCLTITFTKADLRNCSRLLIKGINKVDANSILQVFLEVCRNKLFQRIVIMENFGRKPFFLGRHLMYFVANGELGRGPSYARGSCTPRQCGHRLNIPTAAQKETIPS